jgi:hypothetical protein
MVLRVLYIALLGGCSSSNPVVEIVHDIRIGASIEIGIMHNVTIGYRRLNRVAMPHDAGILVHMSAQRENHLTWDCVSRLFAAGSIAVEYAQILAESKPHDFLSPQRCPD